MTFDKTYCLYWQKCKKGGTCSRAWTPKLEHLASLSGVRNVSFYSDKPECFEVVNESTS